MWGSIEIVLWRICTGSCCIGKVVHIQIYTIRSSRYSQFAIFLSILLSFTSVYFVLVSFLPIATLCYIWIWIANGFCDVQNALESGNDWRNAPNRKVSLQVQWKRQSSYCEPECMSEWMNAMVNGRFRHPSICRLCVLESFNWSVNERENIY